MKDNIIRDKSFKFALKIVQLYKYLVEEKKEYILSKQVLRSGTAIGALVEEAVQAESKPDFIHKLSIANKEANETAYWLRLLKESGYLEDQLSKSIFQDCTEIIKLLTSIINTTKSKLNKK
jgi:four helix bundle protein